MRVVEHEIESERGRIVGDLALPDFVAEKGGAAAGRPRQSVAEKSAVASAPLPLVIYSHGFNSSGSRGLRFAEAVTQAGFALYGFDFRGGATDSRSEGNPLDMSVRTECDDLAEVVDALAADPRFDARNVFLFGASFGGLVSALVAARAPEKIRGLILHYPGFCIPDDLHAQFASLAAVPQTFFELSMNVGRRFAEGAWNLDPYETIAAYGRPVLITHGTADELVDPSYSQRAAMTYTCAELHLIDGAGHGFHGPELKEATDYLVDYLLRERA